MNGKGRVHVAVILLIVEQPTPAATGPLGLTEPSAVVKHRARLPTWRIRSLMAWDAGGYQPYSLADDLTFRARGNNFLGAKNTYRTL